MARLIVVAGASGAGKTYTGSHLINYRNDIIPVKKYATRNLRKNEPSEESIDLKFGRNISEIKECKYIYQYGEYYYGIKREEIDNVLRKDKNPLVFVNNSNLVSKMKQDYYDALILYVMGINGEESKQQLIKRCDSIDINERMKRQISGLNDYMQHMNKKLLINHYDDSFLEFIEEELNNSDNPKYILVTLSPINDKVMKYLSENPDAFYQLSDDDFEIVMAEIYSKLGYDVTRTQSTRDGGKDIIIRKTEILGDFIYYVECKKYAPKRHIGVGIVRNLVGTVNTDRVNGGILATTSFFTKDARKFISDNKWNCQIKMHDYDVIQELLKKTL